MVVVAGHPARFLFSQPGDNCFQGCHSSNFKSTSFLFPLTSHHRNCHPLLISLKRFLHIAGVNTRPTTTFFLPLEPNKKVLKLFLDFVKLKLREYQHQSILQTCRVQMTSMSLADFSPAGVSCSIFQTFACLQIG